MVQIDLNCDLGESYGPYKMNNDYELLKYITSANVACGFHSGDPSVMRETVYMAIQNNVKIGAHPGLPDLLGFGRREMNITPQEAYDMVVYQIGALQGVLSTFGEEMQHVKPHGALYNMAAQNVELAKAIAQAVYDISPSLLLFGLAESELTKAGEAIGLRTAHEVFADRTYQADGSLTSRSQTNAIITDENQSIAQVLKMVKEGKVITEQQTEISLRAHTLCLHGDNEKAFLFAKTIKEALDSEKVLVKSF